MAHEMQSTAGGPTSLFHTEFVCSLASGSQQTHYTLQCSGIHTIPIKTQATIFYNLKFFFKNNV